MAMVWMFRPNPPKFKCSIWMANVMAVGGRTFGRWLGLKRRALMNVIDALTKEALERSWAPFQHVWLQWEVCNLEEGLYPTVLEPWTHTSSLQSVRDKFVFYKPPLLVFCCSSPSEDNSEWQCWVPLQSGGTMRRLYGQPHIPYFKAENHAFKFYVFIPLQVWTNVFCKGWESKYFRFGRRYIVSVLWAAVRP